MAAGAGWGVNVNDASPTDATSGATIGGLSFGSMGSGIHTTTSGGALPPWLLYGALAVAALFLLRKRGR